MSILSTNDQEAFEIASMLGKRDRGEERVYYRKINDLVRSILIPSPDSILDEAIAVSISSSFYFKVSDAITWLDGERALLLEASGLPGIILTNDTNTFMKYFSELSISKLISEFREFDMDVSDRGLVYVDRAFNVKGVGVVVLGYALTQVSVHDKFIAYPMNVETEIKSIQVLDEDQDSVMPGTRVGLALRNTKLEDIDGVQALIRPGTKFINSINDFNRFKWSDDAREVHVIFNGIKVMGKVEGNSIVLTSELPMVSGRALIINVNAKPKKPRIMGYAIINA
ncbi:Selenocysteine-specific translation elongation factor-like protein [Vulcanisaeta moutnovskia 768-28]|uniref:Selenocysteine-specific translation elongation factor-like protein n=1 Tax=Vulcanisaeta moutnovskia (strain 768-28) TaxID=985053 RepID=F0QYD6_VULM7|nr:Selenocysteine-specific translation elongation factor-like protein [Vulcanisaeta moutnovskia 768-28]